MEIRVQNLCKSYSGVPVLRDVTFTAGDGVTCVMAPSGGGKTTLCKLLAGWEEPAGGQVLLDGLPLARYRGFCPVQLLWQHPEEAVDPLLKLRATLYEAGPVDPAVLEGLCVREEWLERYPAELKFLLCDEASAMLDLVTQARLWRFLLDQGEKRGLGMLIVSHDTALLERVCTRILTWEDITAPRRT